MLASLVASWPADDSDTEDPPPPPPSEYTAAIVHCHRTNIALLSEIIQCPRLTDFTPPHDCRVLWWTPEKHKTVTTVVPFLLVLVRSAGRLGEGPAGVTMDTAAASTQLIAPPTPTPPRPRQINLANIEPRQLYQLTFYCGKIWDKTHHNCWWRGWSWSDM